MPIGWRLERIEHSPEKVALAHGILRSINQTQGILENHLWNIITDGSSRLDSQLNIVKNMDDFMLYGRNLNPREA